jgi:hypothetical protein
MKKKARCYRCKLWFKLTQLVSWLEDTGDLSPKFCPPCYYWILDHWEEGQQVLDFEDTDSGEEA